jgi:hypothetical protein
MRPSEDELIDPEIAEQLDAIEATLAGEPVAPRFAELAELALLLAAERPEAPRPEFTRELDRRVQARFGADGAHGAGVPPRGARGARGARLARGWRRWGGWGLTPALGAAATALVVVVAVVAVGSSGGGRGTATTVHTLSGAKAPAGTTGTTSASTSAPAAAAGGVRASAPPRPASLGPANALARTVHSKTATPITGPAPTTPITGPALGSAGAATAPAGPSSAGASTAAGGPSSAQAILATPSPAPLPNGRKIIQSSILELGSAPRRIDAVAQQVFTVVRAVNGIVESSNVSSTGGPGASAQFQLRIPSPLLSDALSALSKLRYANVISRTDGTQDVNSPFLSSQRRIAAAKAALVRLRAKLAAATTETEIATLRRQVAGENAILARAQGSLRSLNQRVDFSNVYVTLQATTGGGVTPGAGNGGGFGLHRASHDAIRVLEVTAGIALIVLAALVPLALVAALAWWLAGTVQRRRRERALDLA